MLLVRIIAMVQQSADPEDTLQRFLQFCHRTENENLNLTHKLIGEQFAGQIALLMRLISEALPSLGVEYWYTPQGFRSLLALIGTNGQGVGTSAISVWVRYTTCLQLNQEDRIELDKFIDKLYENLDNESGTFLNNEGSALYVLQSSCNHSCVPNAQPNFMHNNYRLSMVALKDIAAGDEICISYLDECVLERSRHTRQKYLEENYLFRCDCTRCESQAGDPDITSEEEMNDDDDNVDD